MSGRVRVGERFIGVRTCCTRETRVGIRLLLLLFPRRSDGPASVHATVNVLLFLFSRFQNLF